MVELGVWGAGVMEGAVLALAAAPLDEVVGAGLLAVDLALLCHHEIVLRLPQRGGEGALGDIDDTSCNAGRRLALEYPDRALCSCVAQPKPSARCVAYFLLVQYSPGTEPPDGQRARKAGH